MIVLPKNIGIKLGNRNHATVIYYVNKYIKMVANDEVLKKEINIIRNSLMNQLQMVLLLVKFKASQQPQAASSWLVVT